MKFLDKLLLVKNEKRNFLQIIFWWELRRLLYNFIVLLCLVASLFIVGFCTNKNGEQDLGDPALGIFLFIFLCNVAYTLGWLIELFVKRDVNFAPKLFKAGLYFTLFFVCLPPFLGIFVGIWGLITWLLHLK